MAQRCAFLVAGLLTLAATADARAQGPDALQKACFSPEELQVIAGEWHATRTSSAAVSPTQISTAPAAAAPIPTGQRGAIRRVELPPGDMSIALTFDLCERTGAISGYDGRIIDILRREGIRATLFAGGKWLETHPKRAAQLVSDPLFEIANHSQAHRNLRLLDAAARRKEITAPEQAYQAVKASLAARQCTANRPQLLSTLAPRMTLFRFPFGACDAASLAAVNDAGLRAIQWDVSTGDPDPHVSAQSIARNLVARAKPGSIVIAHANGRGWNTADALQHAVPLLRAKGFTFVTVSELLARGTPVITQRCYDSRPGDTDRYDNPARIAKLSSRKRDATAKSNPTNRSKKAKWQRTATRQIE